VAEHGRPRLESGALLDLALQPLADPAQPHVTELVLGPVAADRLHRALPRLRALGHDHDREVAPALVAPAHEPADLVDVERALGDQDDVGPAGHPRPQRDPARVAAHHLDDQVAVV
jgi:hypothetical protein